MALEKKIGTGEEALGDSIARLSQAVQKLQSGSKVNQEAIEILLAKMSNLPKRTVNIVLHNLKVMHSIYCK